MMDVNVKVLGEANDFLARRREELQEEKTEAEHKREDFRTSVKAQEDIAAKRLQNKLQRDKTQEAKELLTQEELIIIANEDLEHKLQDEKKKFEDLLSGRQDIEEKLKRRTTTMTEDKVAVADQDAKLAELKALIDEEQKLCDEQSADLEKAKKLNKYEEAKSRDLQQKNAALTAKLEFIEQGYDYKGNV
jgi:hypothetical protein